MALSNTEVPGLRKLGVVRRQSPEVTAAEHEMYSHDGADGSRDRRAELLLADLVDGPGQSPLKVLHEGGQLTQEQYRPLATFVASLHVRTPAFREPKLQNVGGASRAAGGSRCRTRGPKRCAVS